MTGWILYGIYLPYILVKHPGIYNRVKHNINDGLWLIMMSQYYFSNVTCITQMNGIKDGEAVCWGDVGTLLSAQLCCTPKTALKTKIY